MGGPKLCGSKLACEGAGATHEFSWQIDRLREQARSHKDWFQLRESLPPERLQTLAHRLPTREADIAQFIFGQIEQHLA